jgi:asparaginyl-tRNA synthetase
MIEPEMAFCDLAKDMQVAEEFVSYIVQSVLKNRSKELTLLERNLDFLAKVEAPFPKIHYNEAVEILKKNNIDFEHGGDFGGTDETIISEQFDRPVIVHHYPAQVKAFYMKRDPEKPQFALAMDMLAPEGYGEIIGGSQREDDIDALISRVKEHNLPEKAFAWYLDLRKYGSVPHAGFGLGIERTVSWICGLPHVRETIPFPRLMNRLYP